MVIKSIIPLVVLLIFFVIDGELMKSTYATEDENINFYLDKTWYFPRDNIQVQGWVDTLEGPTIQIEIINPNNLVIYHENVPIQEPKEIEHTIATFGQQWNEVGFYKIKILYGDEIQTRFFSFGNFDVNEFEPLIELDKETYSWTESVKIMIISPNDNKNDHQIDKIKIKITSRAGTLSSYILEETGMSYGVFSGEVTLTGHPDYDVNEDGKKGDVPGFTIGVGPEDGFLSVYPHDIIKVSFSTPFFEETLEETATIEFQKGTAQWANLPIYQDQKITARVIDPDMNLQSESKDHIQVLVQSYPQNYSKEYSLEETTKNSGIFEKKIQLVSTSIERGFLARSGSKVFLKYEDKTLPIDYPVNKVTIISNATVSEPNFPKSPDITEQKIPSWIKNTAEWWYEDSIGDDGFLRGVEYLIENEIIKIHVQSSNNKNETSFVPIWFKITAKWWSEDKITDEDFLESIKYLVEKRIIVV